MAEILILKRKHFAEDVKPAEWSDLKWMGRPRQGDIISVQPNGTYRIEALGTGRAGWDRTAFAMIRITNASVDMLRYLMQSYSNKTGTEPETVWYKRRYRIDTWLNIPWIKNIVTVNGVTAEEWYYIRPNMTGIALLDKTA